MVGDIFLWMLLSGFWSQIMIMKQGWLINTDQKVVLIKSSRLFTWCFCFKYKLSQLLVIVYNVTSIMNVLFCDKYCGYWILWFNTVVSAASSKQQQLSHTLRMVQLSDHRSTHRVAAATHVFQRTTATTQPSRSYIWGPITLITWDPRPHNCRTTLLAFVIAPVWC